MAQDGLSFPSTIRGLDQEPNSNPNPNPNSNPVKKKRSSPGMPDPDAEVIALSPRSLTATDRFICEICHKGFLRDQNLQLHRRAHNLPWKLKRRSNKEIKKKVYVCPERTCIHHNPSRALGDLTGIKKHYSRKHGEKKWKCEKCSKRYAVQSDWKAHSKICGTKNYKCHCGAIFSRKDSFTTHRAFCDTLAQENATSHPASADLGYSFFAKGITSTSNPPYAGNSQVSPLSRHDFRELIPLQNLNPHGQERKLQWLDQASSSLSQTGVMASNSNPFLVASSSSALPQLVQRSTPKNVMGSSSSLQWGVNKEEENKSNLHSSTTSHMSATALPQQGGQLGSTRSNPSLNNGTCTFGVVNTSSFNTSQIHSISKDTQVYNLFTVKRRAERRFNEFMNSVPLWGSGGLINGEGCLMGDPKSRSFSEKMDCLMMPCPNEVESDLTRDFLGVGDENQSTILQQELAKIFLHG